MKGVKNMKKVISRMIIMLIISMISVSTFGLSVFADYMCPCRDCSETLIYDGMGNWYEDGPYTHGYGSEKYADCFYNYTSEHVYSCPRSCGYGTKVSYDQHHSVCGLGWIWDYLPSDYYPNFHDYCYI